MESQESDIYTEDVYQMLMDDPQVQNIDFSDIQMPAPQVTPTEVIAATENATGHTPTTEPWSGPHNFEISVDLSGNHKKPYFVSSKLNKLFVDIDKLVPIRVMWDGTPELFVRGVMVFTQADYMNNPVKRCITHRDDAYNKQKGFKHYDHVLACANPDAKYEMDADSQRFSVVVPLGTLPEGSNYIPVSYKFMCKTSCPGGLNRALTDIIFTLEDKERVVVGRQKLSVKICSCPKRDKEREEEILGNPPGKKRTKVSKQEKAAMHSQIPAKKIKTENDDDDDEEIDTFVVSVKGKRRAQELRTMIRVWDFFKAGRNIENTSSEECFVHIEDNYVYFPPPL